MESGKLRHVMYIEQYTASVGTASGDRDKDWTRFAKVRASIRYFRGDEIFRAAQYVATQVAEIRMRYLPGLDETMRIVHGDKVFNILYINNVNDRNRELVITCETGMRE